MSEDDGDSGGRTSPPAAGLPRVSTPTASVPATAGHGNLVQRSTVPDGLAYAKYRRYLRPDFFWSCAYCTMSEAEAQSLRHTIDHYEPRKARPDLENDYGNLMYACDMCNIYKGDRTPPPDARAAGIRFFRPDQDVRSDHFRLNGLRVEPLTDIGNYTSKAVELNRKPLRRLREIRSRLLKSTAAIAEGITALRRARIDQLPVHMKPQVTGMIARATKAAEDMELAVDAILRKHAESPYLNDDPDEGRPVTEAPDGWPSLDDYQTLYPERWRAPRSRGST
jgi:hypothetical protein